MNQYENVYFNIKEYQMVHGSLHIILSKDSRPKPEVDIYMENCDFISGKTSDGPCNCEIDIENAIIKTDNGFIAKGTRIKLEDHRNV